jgi:MFS family permease
VATLASASTPSAWPALALAPVENGQSDTKGPLMTPERPSPSQPIQGEPAAAGSEAALRRGGIAAIVASFVFPLVLTQFIASYAGSNMNVAISSIAEDLETTTHGVQTAITLFTLTMAALMIPGSKLTDIIGRKRCFMLGLLVYGFGALLASFAQGLGLLIVGYSLLEGIGSALMIPPIYIILTVAFANLESRAKAFGLVSAAAGLGAAAGPLIGGVITSAISWRASFIAQVLVVACIIVMSRKFSGAKGTKSPFDITGTILSAAGLIFVVFGILQSGNYGWLRATKDVKIGDTVLISEGGISPVWPLMAIGALFLAWFFYHIRAKERAGEEPLLSTRLFRNRTSNLGLITQNVQWLILQGSFFVISVFLQTVRGYSAIETGLILTASTVGLLLSSGVAGRLAKRRPQVVLIRAGFVTWLIGAILLLLISDATSSVWTFLPGLFLMGVGIGVMLTSSVNVVQSSFPEQDQGEISGLSRSISNLGSSLGTALVGSVLVSAVFIDNDNPNTAYAAAMIVMIVCGLIGLGAALLIRRDAVQAQGESA